jgi:D-alanyl-D-alanine carboxypeptidase
MHMKPAIWAFLLSSLSIGSSVQAEPTPKSPETGSHATRFKSIDDYLSAEMQKRHVPAVSIAIVQDGKTLLAKGYGLANVELSVPATEKTVYQLASVTKQFTALAIVMLAEEGKLALDDKIVKHLADLPSAWKAVTVRQLLNHTSGIKSYTSVKDFFESARNDYSHQQILNLVAKDPLEFPSGEKWNYSNTGYFLLGMIIEKVSGKSYGDFLDQRIFKPLGMTQTRANDLHAIIPNRAQGYTWDDKVLRNAQYVSPTQPYSAGMLVSSIDDMIKWDAALSTETLLKKPALELLWTRAKLTKGAPADYGMGWGITKVNGHRLVSHAGGIPGFSTVISRFLDDKLTVIVLTNSDNGNADALARGIAKRVLPALSAKPAEPIADTDVPTSNRLKGVLASAMKGEADPELFSDSAKKLLVPHLKNQGKAMFAPLGALKTFQLLERKASDSGTRLRYRAVFNNMTMNASITLDRAGKVMGLEVRPEDY